MRIVALSDSHGNTGALMKAVRQQPQADCFIFLGDGLDDIRYVMKEFPKKTYYAVSGNCDFTSPEPCETELELCGRKLFFTHGNRYFVKGGLTRIEEEAKRRGADILLFGHTHKAMCEYVNGLYVINPGSIGLPDGGRPTYGIIDITTAGIAAHIAEE